MIPELLVLQSQPIVLVPEPKAVESAGPASLSDDPVPLFELAETLLVGLDGHHENVPSTDDEVEKGAEVGFGESGTLSFVLVRQGQE
jgi:hypothetical protein